jgi:hypothetical protein
MLKGGKFANGQNYMNGHLDMGEFKEYQAQRFDSLENVLRQGFDQVTEELRLMREQGHIPISIAKQITEQQRAFVMPVIKFLCVSMIMLVVWFTGLKAALPHIFAQ